MTDEARRSRRFGWTAVAVWALFGVAIEAAHGFKLAVYLDDDLRHTLLRLAHAHGVILGLVVLTLAGAGSPYAAGDRGARVTGVLLRLAALIIPVGFAASAVAPHEGDPGVPVVLVPVGGVVLVAGLTRAAWRSWRGP